VYSWQEECIDDILDIIEEHGTGVVVLAIDTIGKEDLVVAIAEMCDAQVRAVLN
jgi:hypothetical protein